MRHICRGRLFTGIAIGAFAVAVPLASVGNVAGGTSPAPNVAVAHGVSPASLPGVVVFGNTPPSTPEQVSFILQERNQGQLEASVEQGVSHFLSVSQFAQIYGQTRDNIAALEHYLAGFGITTSSYADGIDVTAAGTAGAFDAALSVHQDQYRVPAEAGRDGTASVPAQTVHGPTSAPLLPRPLAQFVLAILGLSNYAPFTSQALHTPGNTAAHAAAGGSGSTAACVTLTGDPSDCNTPQTFEADYGLTGLEHHGTAGAGQTLAIVTLAAVDPGAPQYFWQHVIGLPASGRTLTVNNVDGGPGAPSNDGGSGESDLDVEQSGGIAPGANVVVYQAPNTDNGFADGFADAASQNLASSVSASWGESETYVQAAVASGIETPAYDAAFDEIFLEFAAQGQSGFLSSGDNAAYDASADLGTTNLSVDTSADSPYITASGGTTLAWTGPVNGPDASPTVTVPAQRAWGWDYLWSAFATGNGTDLTTAAEGAVIGSGGGFSSFYPTPSYQQGVPGTSSYSDAEYLTPTTVQNVDGINEPTAWNFTDTPSLGRGHNSGRALPDLSTDADPFTGYLLYAPSFAQANQPLLQGGWGGTSFVAPQLNGSAAVIDAAVGHRVGLWNPSIYRFAQSWASPFTPLNQASTGNDNLFYTGTPGTLYNPATGLGIPDLGRLAADFAFQG